MVRHDQKPAVQSPTLNKGLVAGSFKMNKCFQLGQGWLRRTSCIGDIEGGSRGGRGLHHSLYRQQQGLYGVPPSSPVVASSRTAAAHGGGECKK